MVYSCTGVPSGICPTVAFSTVAFLATEVGGAVSAACACHARQESGFRVKAAMSAAATSGLRGTLILSFLSLGRQRATCSFNGQPTLRVKDTTFGDAGGVGVWTKADAASAFDDLEVRLR